ncbi:unnamed protein product [Brassica oleracea]
MAFCAAAAIRHSTRRRPKMSQIVRALEGDTSIEDLSKGGRARGMTRARSEREKRIKRCGSSGSTVADLVDQTLRI